MIIFDFNNRYLKGWFPTFDLETTQSVCGLRGRSRSGSIMTLLIVGKYCEHSTVDDTHFTLILSGGEIFYMFSEDVDYLRGKSIYSSDHERS